MSGEREVVRKWGECEIGEIGRESERVGRERMGEGVKE